MPPKWYQAKYLHSPRSVRHQKGSSSILVANCIDIELLSALDLLVTLWDRKGKEGNI